MSTDRVVALVLAAGYSRRFGADDKRLARLPDGRPLLAATLARAAQAFPLRRVVLRQEDDPQALELATSIEAIRVSRAERGLGASLGEAIAALSDEPALAEIEAVAVLLGDMPDICLETLHALRGLASRSSIVRPRYAGLVTRYSLAATSGRSSRPWTATTAAARSSTGMPAAIERSPSRIPASAGMLILGTAC